MRWRRRGTARGAAIAVAVVALLAGGSPVASSAAKKKGKKAAAPAPFCTNPADNYMAPLEKLRRLPAVPTGGALPFASGLTLGATGPQGVLVGGSNIGFRLSNTTPAGGVAPKLSWTVLERLTRLTHEGHRLHPAGLKRIDLKQLPAEKHRGLTFPIPATPAIYSLEVTIQNHRGRLLGRYGEYIRVVDRVVNVGLTLASYDKVAPGAYVESCFENHGSASVTPTGTSLERLDGGSWRPVVVGPQYSPAQSAIQRTLGPGESEKIGTLVPPNALPGLYRLNATGSVLDSGESVGLTAEFGVG
ncbi:MAG TPA: hypothetical protein VHV53_09260 [Solirubrobacterales bacterium]|jgi:hypothetical protein|nr:hypothetical protein [Solirubrobacterales bacterium]